MPAPGELDPEVILVVSSAGASGPFVEDFQLREAVVLQAPLLLSPYACHAGSESLCLLWQVKKLQSILKPMMLRRLKDDVEKNLAPKQETIIEVELTNIQKKYYRAILEKNFSFLSKGANQHNMPNLINTMMELRKCCNHPYLINGEGCAQEVRGLCLSAPFTGRCLQGSPSSGPLPAVTCFVALRGTASLRVLPRLSMYSCSWGILEWNPLLHPNMACSVKSWCQP